MNSINMEFFIGILVGALVTASFAYFKYGFNVATGNLPQFTQDPLKNEEDNTPSTGNQ